MIKATAGQNGFSIGADVGVASIEFDDKGNLSASSGIIKGKYALATGLQELGVEMKELNFYFSDFSKDSMTLSMSYNQEFMGFNYGKYIMNHRWNINVNPKYYIDQTVLGQNYEKYRNGTTNRVNECMANNFEGC